MNRWSIEVGMKVKMTNLHSKSEKTGIVESYTPNPSCPEMGEVNIKGDSYPYVLLDVWPANMTEEELMLA